MFLFVVCFKWVHLIDNLISKDTCSLAPGNLFSNIFQQDFQRFLLYSRQFSFIVKTCSDHPGKAIYLPIPHSPTHPETSPSDSVSGWPLRQTYGCLFPVTSRLGYKTPPLPPWACAHSVSLGLFALGEASSHVKSRGLKPPAQSHPATQSSFLVTVVPTSSLASSLGGSWC